MKLGEIVSLNANFKNAINLYLNLNKEDKIRSYIPTSSSVAILDEYLEAVNSNQGKANILIGPYGKGKSHLLLILLAILSKENDEGTLNELVDKINIVDKNVSQKAKKYLKSTKKILPVIISNSQDDLRQSFMIALNSALNRCGLEEVMPDTYFSEAIKVIGNWKKNYKETYEKYIRILKEKNISAKEFVAELENCESNALVLFKEIYPNLTSGSEFNPLTGGDVLIMYKSVAEAIKEYGYSGIYVIFDEFSKYIESQSKNAVGQNMKIVQDFCELSDDSKDPQIFVTLVTHKAIKEYGNFLPEQIINAFTGIEGRIKDIEFITSSKNNYELIKNAIQIDEKSLSKIPCQKELFSQKRINDYYYIPVFKANFKEEDFERIVYKGCYPLNPCTSYLLLNISEKVAQNERTLFTFISKDEANSLAQYVKKHTEDQEWIVNADLIYDYFKGIFKKNVNEEYIHNEWLNAEYSLKKAQNEEEKKILKTIAIINIVNKPDDLAANVDNICLSSNLSNAEKILDELEHRKVLYKNNSTGNYKFKTRAGSELKKEIQKRRELKGERINIPESLFKISDNKYFLPKQYNYRFSMTRYYNCIFMQIDDFLQIDNYSVIFDKEKHEDGIVINVFSVDGIDYSKEIINHMNSTKVKNLVVSYAKKPFTLHKEILDYEIIQDLKNSISFMNENEIFQKELIVMEDDLEEDIKKYLNDNFGSSNVDLVLFHDGKEWIFREKYPIDKAVDSSCGVIYTKTLNINNELINKQNITTAPIKKARKIIIEKVLKKTVDEQFINGTGPESTIYRAVLVNTGIVNAENNNQTRQLLDIFTRYIDSCVQKKYCLKNLTDSYYAAPFGMRSGVLPIILAFAISYRNGDVVIYKDDLEVEASADSIVAMCENPEDYSLYISEQDARKEDYLKNLIETFDPDCYASLTGTRITNVFTCMQRWYRSLPQVTKNINEKNDITGEIDFIEVIPQLKKALQRADSNAYETIFVKLPELCGVEDSLVLANSKLKEIKLYLDSYYDKVLDYLISETIKVFDKKTKHDLIHTLREWYENQSDNAKNGLSDNDITLFMNSIRDLDTFDEKDAIQKIAKTVTGIYVDSWDDRSLTEYFDNLTSIKRRAEEIKDDNISGKQVFSFTDAKGITQHKYFEKASDPSADILKNIINDSLEDFGGLSVNDKVAVLVEMLENVINREK